MIEELLREKEDLKTSCMRRSIEDDANYRNRGSESILAQEERQENENTMRKVK